MRLHIKIQTDVVAETAIYFSIYSFILLLNTVALFHHRMLMVHSTTLEHQNIITSEPQSK